MMYLQSVQTSVPSPLLAVVISWLVAIFISFGLFAPRNYTVIVTLIVCALAASPRSSLSCRCTRLSRSLEDFSCFGRTALSQMTKSNEATAALWFVKSRVRGVVY